MNIFLAIIALVGGFVLLIKGADWFVEGSSSVAKLLKVPTIIIGLTVVAFGTSLPEASVSISSALAGKNALAICTISDHLLTGEATTAEERQNSFTQMMEVALEVAVAMN